MPFTNWFKHGTCAHYCCSQMSPVSLFCERHDKLWMTHRLQRPNCKQHLWMACSQLPMSFRYYARHLWTTTPVPLAHGLHILSDSTSPTKTRLWCFTGEAATTWRRGRDNDKGRIHKDETRIRSVSIKSYGILKI